jgi:uracil-DNA glycosylase family 4
MKVIVAGSRTITDYQKVKELIKVSGFVIDEIVSGAARGVDLLGERYAKENNIPIKQFKADWDTYGKRAGYLRNVQMAEYADALVAVWDGISSGTKHMIDTMNSKDKPVFCNKIDLDIINVSTDNIAKPPPKSGEPMNKSFGQCDSCPLNKQTLIVGETNCKDDISKVELLVIAEAPAYEEVLAGRPLAPKGKAGSIFRHAFNNSKLNTVPYYITNTVLCSNLRCENGRYKTDNPPEEAVKCCEKNLEKIIEATDPKLIFAMGNVPLKRFGISEKGGITKLRGKLFKYKNRDILFTIHPSALARSGGISNENEMSKFINDFKYARDIIAPSKESNNYSEISTSGIYSYSFEDWMMSDEYVLIDVQRFYSYTEGEVLFTFRNSITGEKRYYSKKDTEYYFYTNEHAELQDAPMIEHIENVKVVHGKPSKTKYIGHYESDVRTEIKNSIDYYYQRKIRKCEEKSYTLKKLFFDIEVYSAGDRSFPDPKKAERPINAISFKADSGPINIWLAKLKGVDSKYTIDKFNDHIQIEVKKKQGKETVYIPTDVPVNLKIFNSEEELLRGFCDEVKQINPDIMCGWNCLKSGESTWLTDRIKSIDDVIIGMTTYNNGVVKNHIKTGTKKNNKITLINGLTLNCSSDHVIPVYMKQKQKYGSKNVLVKSGYDLKVSEIKNKLYDNNCYVKLNIHKNNNCDYTYRDYFLENIEHLLSYKEFDIYLYHYHKTQEICSLKHQLKKKKITITDIKNKIKDTDQLRVVISGKGKRIVNIDLSEKIEKDELELMGYEYTDGFWSKYDNSHHITTKSYELIEKYSRIMNKYRKSKREDLQNLFSHSVYDYNMGYANKYTLLMPFIYDQIRKKNLNLCLLSRLSEEQFKYFLNGMIDGDGCVNGAIDICNYENDGLDKRKISELLLWNGCYNTISKASVRIPFIERNKSFITSLNITHSFRRSKLHAVNFKTTKNSKSKYLDKMFYDDFILVKINNIVEENECEMYDISTESSYFISGGILVHNCSNFDFPTIFGRMKHNKIKINELSPVGTCHYNPERYSDFYIGGIALVDQLELYKELTYQVEESYKLSAIAQKHLGKNKVAYEGTLDSLYENDLEKFIMYSAVDTILLWELDEILGHIEQKNELRRVCSSTWKVAESTMGLIDPLVISFAKEQGLVCRDGLGVKETEKIVGAYVRNPNPGLHGWLIDFDYKSLYPSIICTMNIGPNTFIAKVPQNIAEAYIYNQEDRFVDSFEITYSPLCKSSETKEISWNDFGQWLTEQNLILTISGAIFLPHDNDLSFLYKIIKYLIDSRDVYKSKMKEATKNKDELGRMTFNNRQLAFKILANSIYGVLANSAFRLFNNDMAQTVTFTGQEAIKFIGHHIGHYLKDGKTEVNGYFMDNYEEQDIPYLLYTDTDSIFLRLGDYLCDVNKLKF